MYGKQNFDVKIAELYFRFHSNSPQILLDSEGSIKHYCKYNLSNDADYCISFSTVSNIDLSDYKLVFTGEPENNEFLNYNWYVYEVNDKIAIYVEFVDHSEIKGMVALFSSNSSSVIINVLLHEQISRSVIIDPLMHPLGSLLLLYLVHWKQGALIHASAIKDSKKAYLFTGVSGIGKSTMARLWSECGAEVLNDDRLVIRIVNGDVKLYNNPMPYYQQEPAEAILKKIFLLKQSPQNYIKRVTGVFAYSRVLGNFIQQFYHPEMVKKHLGIVEQVIDNVQVFEVGFKPDHDIVSLIREMDDNG